MQVGLDIGTRWGQTVAFDYDTRPYIEAPTDFNGVRFRKMTDEEASQKDIHGLKKYIEDTNGNLMKNPMYLHIIAPSGEEVTEKDYEEKVDKVEITEEVAEDVLDNDNLYSPFYDSDDTLSRDHTMKNNDNLWR